MSRPDILFGKRIKMEANDLDNRIRQYSKRIKSDIFKIHDRAFKCSFKLKRWEKEQFAKLAVKEMKSIMVKKLRKGDVVYRIKYDEIFVVRKSHWKMNPPYLILNFDLPTELINHVVIENKGFVKIGRL